VRAIEQGRGSRVTFSSLPHQLDFWTH